jgi:hypothetical protein
VASGDCAGLRKRIDRQTQEVRGGVGCWCWHGEVVSECGLHRHVSLRWRVITVLPPSISGGTLPSPSNAWRATWKLTTRAD